RTEKGRARARPRLEAPLDVQGRPGAIRLVLGEAAGVLGGAAECRLVGLLRHPAADRGHDQPDGAADGRVGAEARTEEVPATVETDLAGNRSVDAHHRP